ncbi:acylneuraminate cytidylyltransferase family protein [Aureispira sp. CCB-E]|uniref:acylneuraminate cytidylyltransferase family protein n=1 Tax=Aureispira sp. CCB-E TaxID=3051121 RepID=UPI0028684E4D|nr:acylneuraminate cytidylyltransferase family protein [Aureispira sp. CCB-E]WMX16019.1 acylneuraminate cytidylyltransferase family protein [Aureispira sp. CCB-E]
MNNMNVLITICARGGSKGLPGKNVKEIAGKPLIAYSIATANKFAKSYGGKVIITLSTDSKEIRTIASEHGLVTDYIRPAALATDKISKTPALKDILKYEEERNQIKFDLLIDFDITSPMRTIEDIETAIKIIENDRNAVNLVTVNTAHRNPYFNMLEEKEDGYFGVSKKTATPFYSRQGAPIVYDMNSSFYIFKRHYFENNYNGSLTDRTLVYKMPHACFDVDSLDDFEYMEYLITTGKWEF